MLISQNVENNGFEPLILVKVLLIIIIIVSNLIVGVTGFEPAIPREPKPLVRPSHRTPSYNNTNIFLLIRISNNNSIYLTKINNYKFLKNATLLTPW